MIESLTSIANAIINFDNELLLAINSIHAPWADTFMQIVSSRTVWIPFYLFLSYLLVRRFGWRKTIVGLLVLAVCITLVDQICGSVLRGLVGRMRPSNPDSYISQWVHIVDNYRGGRYGFPSCHAANASVTAAFVSGLLRRSIITALMIAWVLLICWSRMYLGVHYPGDILAGILFGLPFGLGGAYISHTLMPHAVKTITDLLNRLYVR